MAAKGRTYKATGITLKSMPMGESDRLLTILTKEHGLVRAITPGARKPKSSLRAISTGFVVGDLLIVKGRNLDKLVQADCRASFPGLSRDLGKLTAAQYLAELALGQALSQNPQDDLYNELLHALDQIAQRSPQETLPLLVQGILRFLMLAGVAPQLDQCCVTQVPITPNLANPNWKIRFDASVGGAIALQESRSDISAQTAPVASSAFVASPSGNAIAPAMDNPASPIPQTPHETPHASERYGTYRLSPEADSSPAQNIARTPIPKPILKKKAGRPVQLNAIETVILQSLTRSEQSEDALSSLLKLSEHSDNIALDGIRSNRVWLMLEKTLRDYTQYHFDQPIRSAALIETCFLETMSLETMNFETMN